jgi:DNA-directed RNA polymerase specialized sigma24 family protein
LESVFTIPRNTQSIAWLRKNRRKLPKMSDGRRINGDPILYAGTQPPDYFSLMQTLPDHFDGQPPEDLSPEEAEDSPITRLMTESISKSGITPIEAWVLAFRIMGVSQQQIADSLQMPRETTRDLEISAKKKLKNALATRSSSASTA